MIGLGSNRLTLARRGGMSVTQAGRGGMEWLAGFRAPSWASPYSAQATAALKAQFPTQWPTIRDYGFAHPALVPFINEDPMLVCSLIPELNSERWLQSDGNCWIDAGRTINLNDIVRFKAYRTLPETSGEKGYFGVRDNGYISYFLATQYYGGNTILDFYYNNNGGGSSTFTNDNSTNPINVELKEGKFYLNGTLKVTRSLLADKQSNINYLIFAVAMQGEVSRKLATKIAYLEHNSKSDDPIAKFVPCKSGGVVGMLDVVGVEFHPKQGSGTMTIIDPS